MDEHVDNDDDLDQNTNTKNCCSWKCLLSVKAKIYIAHLTTTWGDRMWGFAVSLFLIKMANNSELLLTAAYGLSCSLAVILFGALIGRWIDQMPRFQAAVKALVFQNASVVACTIVVSIILINPGDINKDQQWIVYLLQVGVIVTGATAVLAGLASSICLTKDWIVVIANGDKEMLSSINAVCRRIDLTTKICSPFVAGYLMAHVSNLVAAFFIMAWNLVSVAIEYLLLRSIYRSVPELAIDKTQNKGSNESRMADSQEVTEFPSMTSDDALEEAPTGDSFNIQHEVVESPLRTNDDGLEDSGKINKPSCDKMRNMFREYSISWKTYFRHPVFPAGFGLACLYMTVLAFDGITIGYAYGQGVSEDILAGLGALGAVTGIAATLAYPKLRTTIGVERSGLFGFCAEASCLIFCVASVWASGSPFKPSSLLTTSSQLNYNDTGLYNDTGIDRVENTTFGVTPNVSVPTKDYTSVILLMTGITTSRFGLWLADLSVNQILQEEVEETWRGRINGVQYALNMIMDLLKYILVMAFPKPETFGLLVLSSFVLICSGWASFSVYSRRRRHHILPFHRYFENCSGQPIPSLRPKKRYTDDIDLT